MEQKYYQDPLEELKKVKSELNLLRDKVSVLTDSESKLLNIFKVMSEIILKIDKDGRYLDIAPTNPDLLYKPSDELIGKTMHEVFPKEKADFFLENIHLALSVDSPVTIKYELEINLKKFWFSAIIQKVDDESVILIARDITTQQVLEESLKEIEIKFSNAFENAAIGMALVATDGRWLKVNRAICELVGYSEEELLTKTFQDITHPDDLDRDLNYVNQMLKSEIKTYQMEKRYFHKDGRIIWVQLNVSLVRNDKGEPLYFISQIQDITERKKSDVILSSLYEISNAVFRSTDIYSLYKDIHTIVDTLVPVKNIYIAIYDDKTGMLSFPYWVDEYDPPMPPKKLGRGLTEYVLRTGEGILVDPEIDTALRESGEIELIGTQSPVWLGVPLIVGRKTIGVIVVQDYENPNAFGEDELQLLTFISEQIARAIENKRNSDAITKYVEELKELNVTKDKFFSIIAHDLKTPFQFLLGLSEMLYDTESNLTQDEKDKYMLELNNMLKNQYELLQNLLTWSSMQLGKTEYVPSHIDLYDIIEHKIKFLSAAANKKSISIFNELNKNEFVLADRQMLGSIVQNFITNSLKFTERGGKIRIYSKIENEFAKITIEDSGRGISREALDKIYSLESLHTTKGTEGELGTGLGVMLCKEMIEKQGGTLSIESELNKGTKVIFTLPAAEQKS
jgi:PAS domain S-box-containing protein